MKHYNISSPFQLESGAVLEEVTIAYHTFGQLNAEKDNVVWVCHALTANSNPVEWWPGLVGKGKLFDPEKYFIVCANMLGSCYGSTGPTAINPTNNQPFRASFPLVTIRDMVKGHQLLRAHLEIDKIRICIGGSMGGQQAVEWAIMESDRIEKLVLLATNAKHSPWGIAFNETQRMAINADPTLHNGTKEAGYAGLEAARAIAMLSYRSYFTYENTQSEVDDEKMDEFLASSYQRYQGQKLRKRFDVFSYITLSKAMDSHNVGRDRGSIQAALQQIKSKTLVISIQSDVLFPVEEQTFLANYIPNAKLEIIDSFYGHDGFLVEATTIETLVRSHLEQTIFNSSKSAYKLVNGKLQSPLGPTGSGKGLGLPGTETF